MNEKDHLNRTILKLNSFKNKSDEPADSVDITFTTKNNKIDKADGDKLNEEITPDLKNNDSVQTIKKIVPKAIKQKKLLLTEEEYQEVLTYMQKHFPNIFPADSSPIPLVLGIKRCNIIYH